MIANEERAIFRYWRESTKMQSRLAMTLKKLHEDAIEETKKEFLDAISTTDLSYGPERAAYYIIIAKWMQKTDDPLWKSIVGKRIEDKELPR